MNVQGSTSVRRIGATAGTVAGAAGRLAALAWCASLGLGLAGHTVAHAASRTIAHAASRTTDTADAPIGVIPLPAQATIGKGWFTLTTATRVRIPPNDSDARSAASYLIDLLSRSRRPVPVLAPPGKAPQNDVGISFRRRPGLGPEAYRLEVAPDGVVILASTGAGYFYGAVTLWQLLTDNAGAPQVASMVIRDAPAYRWRGLMLDSSRHMQSTAFIRSLLDWMALHKLNVLHWHLTDDQGWRLEIRRYPRLTEVGAWRTPAEVPLRLPAGTAIAATDAVGAAPYGGFYTQEEARGIVAYAASRHIQVVPEIEMPGHAQAAIAAYPELGVTDAGPGIASPTVSARWGVHTHPFNVEPATLSFLENVLGEVIQVFSSPYVHVGGDEVATDDWNASPTVQARMRLLGIADTAALQAYFTQHIGRYLRSHGRRLVGWDEILRPGLGPDAVVMSWHGVSGAHAAAVSGHAAVLSPWPTLYFDNRQSTLATEAPGRLEVVSLEDVYRFSLEDPTLSPAQMRRVLGVQANIWTEHIQTDERVQWMTWPRAAALAEVAWSPAARRDWPSFLRRLVPMVARYQALGLHYADSAFAVGARVERHPAGVGITLSNQAAWGDIRYTLDGRDPVMASAHYTGSLTVPVGTTIHAATFVGAQQVSRVWSQRLDTTALARRDSHDLDLCSKGVGLLLLPGAQTASRGAPLAVDIMNPCWVERGVDLTAGPSLTAAVAPLPFNFELGADAAKIRVGDAATPSGELEVHADTCDAPTLAILPLAPATGSRAVTTLPAVALPRLAGRHDLCLRFARPTLDPFWALDWVEIVG